MQCEICSRDISSLLEMFLLLYNPNVEGGLRPLTEVSVLSTSMGIFFCDVFILGLPLFS